MKMSKKNYKVYAEIETYLMRTLSMWKVSNIGTRPNVLSRNHLQRTGVKIKSADKTIISKTNGRVLKIVCINTLFAIFRTYIVKRNLYVREKRTTNYVMGGEVFEKFPMKSNQERTF